MRTASCGAPFDAYSWTSKHCRVQQSSFEPRLRALAYTSRNIHRSYFFIFFFVFSWFFFSITERFDSLTAVSRRTAAAAVYFTASF